MAQDAEVRNELRRRYSAQIKKRQWTAIARDLGVNPGGVWQVWHGRSRSNKVRKALGLPSFKEMTKMELRRSKSVAPDALKAIQEVVVPWLREKETQNNACF